MAAEKFIVSLDPGKFNFGYAVQRVKVSRTGTVKVNVIENGIVDVPLDSMKVDEFETGVGDFYLWCSQFIEGIEYRNKTKIDVIALERYTTTGARVGPTAEVSNVSIGILATILHMHYPRIKLRIYMNATWKNAINRIKEPEYKKRFLLDMCALCGCTPHQVDAAIIGLYAAEKEMGVSVMAALAGKKFMNKYLTALEETSLYKLTNRKLKRT